MVSYQSFSNASLATVLANLADAKVEPERIVQIFWNGTLYVAVYVNP